MKMSDKLEAAFNEQVTQEFASSLVYRQLAVEMEQQELVGMANWLRIQADEEIVHANTFLQHLITRGNKGVIGGIDAPTVADTSPQGLFEAALANEREISESVRNLWRLAEAEGDLDCRPLLHTFLSEQIREEDTVHHIVGQLKMTAHDSAGVLRLDAELGARGAQDTGATL
ncbi:ferritin [Granulicoccus phenolivorans]|uniref:ferritin n=1 Tax=Granulicoccus phenolivorans TaxID=266854 RepID=UPI0004291FC9|nr:ferritin [Granulicoccus phenolivorans]